jgi:putative flippase GtrA
VIVSDRSFGGTRPWVMGLPERKGSVRSASLPLGAKFAIAPAAATIFCVAAVANFRLTTRFVFRQQATARGFALFLIAALIGLGVNLSVTPAGIAVLGLPPIAAKIGGIWTAFMLNFALNVGIVFRNRCAPAARPGSRPSAVGAAP